MSEVELLRNLCNNIDQLGTLRTQHMLQVRQAKNGAEAEFQAAETALSQTMAAINAGGGFFEAPVSARRRYAESLRLWEVKQDEVFDLREEIKESEKRFEDTKKHTDALEKELREAIVRERESAEKERNPPSLTIEYSDDEDDGLNLHGPLVARMDQLQRPSGA